MKELLAEFLGELVSLLAVAIGSTVFTVLGVLGEQAGMASLQAGSTALAAWELFIGGWALFVGLYLLGYRQVAPRARALLD